MKRLLSPLSNLLQLSLLRTASLLVPAAERQEWFDEWNAELWQVRRTCTNESEFSWEGTREVITFCLGSFPDACCLRDFANTDNPHPEHVTGSARQCLLKLALVFALCVILVRLLPGVRAEINSIHYQTPSNLILIEPAVTPEQFHAWSSTRQRFFDDLAFYSTVTEAVSSPSGHSSKWQITHASSNLFSLLNLPVQYTAISSQGAHDFPSVFLSRQRWERDFKANPQIIGQLVRIGTHTVRIAGVIPDGVWRLPASPDAWLIESDSQLALHTPRSGYVLGHLTRAGMDFVSGNRITITTHGPKDEDIVYFGTVLAEHTRSPWQIYTFALFLVTLALPAVTSVSMSESQFSSYRPVWRRRIHRWLFLAGKIVLLAAIACIAAFDLAYGIAANNASAAELIQFSACFLIGLFGMRWALMDQSHRCPVCLRCVTHPAQVGHASRTFLGWSGTEMICVGGHTLLHVPSLPTSWCGAQRWLYLDTSWDFLFADF